MQHHFASDKRGQQLAERVYTLPLTEHLLLLTLIVIIVIAIGTLVGGQVSEMFARINTIVVN